MRRTEDADRRSPSMGANQQRASRSPPWRTGGLPAAGPTDRTVHARRRQLWRPVANESLRKRNAGHASGQGTAIREGVGEADQARHGTKSTRPSANEARQPSLKAGAMQV